MIRKNIYYQTRKMLCFLSFNMYIVFLCIILLERVLDELVPHAGILCQNGSPKCVNHGIS